MLYTQVQSPIQLRIDGNFLFPQTTIQLRPAFFGRVQRLTKRNE